MESRLVTTKILQSTHLSWIQWRELERVMKRLVTVYKIPVMKIVYDTWCTKETISGWDEAHEEQCLI